MDKDVVSEDDNGPSNEDNQAIGRFTRNCFLSRAWLSRHMTPTRHVRRLISMCQEGLVKKRYVAMPQVPCDSNAQLDPTSVLN